MYVPKASHAVVPIKTVSCLPEARGVHSTGLKGACTYWKPAGAYTKLLLAIMVDLGYRCDFDGQKWCYGACTHAQSSPTLCDPMDCSSQSSLSMEFSRQEYRSGLPFSSQPRDQTYVSCVSCIGRWILYHHATWEA